LKSKLKTKEDTEVTLEITVDSSTVNGKLDELYSKSVQELDLPGFRKGKVPRSFIRARFGEDVFYDDAKEELINQYLPQALQENDIEPVSEPETEEKEFSRDEDFVFEAKVEVMPEIELGDYNDIEVADVETKKVTDEDIDERIDELREENGQLVPKEGEVVEPGDYVTIEFADGTTQQVQVSEEEDSPLSQLLNKETGEVVDFIRGDEDDDSEALELTIKGIKVQELPELDDEFAKDLGYEDLEGLRTEVKSNLFEEREHERTHELGEKILQKILDGSDFEPPEKMLENISENQMEQTVQDMGEDRFADLLESEGKTRDDVISDIQESARDQIKERMAIEEIAELEGIELTDEEIEEELEEEADRQGINPIKLKNQLKASDQFEPYKELLLKHKVYDFLIDNVNIMTEEENNE